MPNSKLKSQIKKLLLQLPASKHLNRLRHNIIRSRELSRLLSENQIAELNPYISFNSNIEEPRNISREIAKDLLDVHGTVCLRKSTSAKFHTSVDELLLYAPLALLSIASSYEDYLSVVGSKTRNMIRKAERFNYQYQAFNWDEHLDEIYEINHSKEVRQDEPMRGWYKEKVQPRNHALEEQPYRQYFGAFLEDKLYAYLHVVRCGDFGFFRHFLGHSEHLPNGIMNGLLSWAVKDYCNNKNVRWLNYGELSSAYSSLHAFKQHNGFKPYATLLNLYGDQEMQEYARRQRRLFWRI